MADEFDVDAMLEDALLSKSDSRKENGDYGNGEYSSRKYDDDGSSKREKKRDSREKKRRSRSREKKRSKRSRSRSRERKRKGSKERRRRSRSKEKKRKSKSPSPSRERERRRSSTPPRLRLGPRRRRSLSPLDIESDAPLSPEERDARTVFCMQLSQRVRARDLEDFFSSVGKVKDVRMITCNKTRRFKGIAYVEFKDIESVALAIGLGGQKLMGVPIIVQPSQAEKNRAGQITKADLGLATIAPGPMKLYVGSLHFNITEEMLRGIFEPFGRIDEILLMKDHETGRSKGFGFITFHEGEDAKRAMEQLNGFEIAGRPMKVGYVTEKPEGTTYYPNPQTFLDTDEMDRAGVNLGVTGRLQLMAKLAEGTDLKIPEAAATALNMQNQIPPQSIAVPQAQNTPPSIATQCFMLSNMFDPAMEASNPRFETEMKDEVLEACMPHGGAVHIFVDKTSPQGNVYVKCPSVSGAVAAVNTLHGRWFAGRLITASYVPLLNYHSLFPDSMIPGSK